VEVPCFWCEPTGEIRQTLHIRHETCGWDKEIAVEYVEGREFRDHPWPTRCENCGAELGWDDDAVDHISGTTHVLVRQDTGEEVTLGRNAPPGAMWDAHWLKGDKHTVDGRYICVILPNGNAWTIDGGSSNCTRKGEDHDCWCRHGEPPNLTVDKNPEPGRSTCQAGGGSIQSGDFHGFLQNGVLRSV
jgi:hypothetical protein